MPPEVMLRGGVLPTEPARLKVVDACTVPTAAKAAAEAMMSERSDIVSPDGTYKLTTAHGCPQVTHRDIYCSGDGLISPPWSQSALGPRSR